MPCWHWRPRLRQSPLPWSTQRRVLDARRLLFRHAEIFRVSGRTGTFFLPSIRKTDTCVRISDRQPVERPCHPFRQHARRNDAFKPRRRGPQLLEALLLPEVRRKLRDRPPSATPLPTDGRLDKTVRDQYLAPLIKAMIKTRTTVSRNTQQIVQQSTLLMAVDKDSAFDNRTVVLLGRHSGEDHGGRDSIPFQIWSVMKSPPACLINLGENDHLFVVAEYVSSATRQWQDREIWNELPKNRPVILVSSRPDRVTRRADEVDAIADFVEGTGGPWCVRIPDDHGSEYSWKDMGSPMVRAKAKQILTTRKLSLSPLSFQN